MSQLRRGLGPGPGEHKLLDISSPLVGPGALNLCLELDILTPVQLGPCICYPVNCLCQFSSLRFAAVVKCSNKLNGLHIVLAPWMDPTKHLPDFRNHFRSHLSKVAKELINSPPMSAARHRCGRTFKFRAVVKKYSRTRRRRRSREKRKEPAKL